ncbi:MAG TPA: tyrosine-type recombinase/integrase [Patescibacteria group bacterium]|nr:tyrosine-type recombinase/integrase [Patescibacteria group bacterium]
MVKSTATKVRRRSAGEGTVYPFRGGHRGAITWTDPDGTRHRRVVAGRTADEARDKLDDLRRELRLGTLTSGPALTVGAFLADWIERDRMRVRPATWRGRESQVRVYLIPALGRFALARLSAADVERAMAAFLATGRPDRPAKRGRGRQNAGGISAQTVRHIRTTLRRALGEAVRAGLAGRNAAADSRPPYLPHRPITYLGARDLAKLLTATRDDELGPIYTMAATTGLRLGELLGLSWADVTEGRLTVRRSLARAHGNGWELAEPKSARSRRTLPLPARARQALETQRTRQRFARNAAGDAWQDRDGLVFTDAIGRPLRPEAVSREFGKARDRAGVPRVRFHDLRHSAATALLTAGVPLAVISEWLGHSGIAITASAYAAIVPELLTEAAAAMDRALGGES